MKEKKTTATPNKSGWTILLYWQEKGDSLSNLKCDWGCYYPTPTPTHHGRTNQVLRTAADYTNFKQFSFSFFLSFFFFFWVIVFILLLQFQQVVKLLHNNVEIMSSTEKALAGMLKSLLWLGALRDLLSLSNWQWSLSKIIFISWKCCNWTNLFKW